MLEGGPGVGAASLAGIKAAAQRAVREHRAVVYVDARGTGESGALHCELDGHPLSVVEHLRSPRRALRLLSPQGILTSPYEIDAVTACRDRLAARADLTPVHHQQDRRGPRPGP